MHCVAKHQGCGKAQRISKSWTCYLSTTEENRQETFNPSCLLSCVQTPVWEVALFSNMLNVILQIICFMISQNMLTEQYSSQIWAGTKDNILSPVMGCCHHQEQQFYPVFFHSTMVEMTLRNWEWWCEIRQMEILNNPNSSINLKYSIFSQWFSEALSTAIFSPNTWMICHMKESEDLWHPAPLQSSSCCL